MMKGKVHYSELKVFDSYDHVLVGDERRQALHEFRLTGAMYGAFFAYGGAAHEDPEDPSTWGPEGPESVDWDGFEC